MRTGPPGQPAGPPRSPAQHPWFFRPLVAGPTTIHLRSPGTLLRPRRGLYAWSCMTVEIYDPYTGTSGDKPASHPTLRGSDPLYRQPDCIAAAEAQRGNASRLTALCQRVQQLDQHRRAAGADGVAQGHRAAVDIDPVGIEAKFAIHSQSLHAKCFVQLEQVDVLQRPGGFAGYLAHRIDRRQAEPLRLAARGGLRPNHGQGPEATLFRGLGTGHNHGGGAIAHTGGVAGGHRATLLERRLEAGEDLYRGVGPDALIFVEDARGVAFLRRRNLHGHDP